MYTHCNSTWGDNETDLSNAPRILVRTEPQCPIWKPLELSKYLEFFTTKHAVVAGRRCGAALFKKTCVDDDRPMLWGKMFKGIRNTSTAPIKLRNSKNVSAWKIHTITVFLRQTDRKLLHNFHITTASLCVQCKTVVTTYSYFSEMVTLPAELHALSRVDYLRVRKRDERESQGCCGFYPSRARSI